jgi:hypothetical protein
MLAPAAIWIGRSNMNISKGTIITPPPRPRRAPRKPENEAINKAININSGVIFQIDFSQFINFIEGFIMKLKLINRKYILISIYESKN